MCSKQCCRTRTRDSDSSPDSGHFLRTRTWTRTRSPNDSDLDSDSGVGNLGLDSESFRVLTEPFEHFIKILILESAFKTKKNMLKGSLFGQKKLVKKIWSKNSLVKKNLAKKNGRRILKKLIFGWVTGIFGPKLPSTFSGVPARGLVGSILRRCASRPVSIPGVSSFFTVV